MVDKLCFSLWSCLTVRPIIQVDPSTVDMVGNKLLLLSLKDAGSIQSLERWEKTQLENGFWQGFLKPLRYSKTTDNWYINWSEDLTIICNELLVITHWTSYWTRYGTEDTRHHRGKFCQKIDFINNFNVRSLTNKTWMQETQNMGNRVWYIRILFDERNSILINIKIIWDTFI